MQTSPRIVGPVLDAKDQIEAILRSVPQWFGIEEALVRYVSDSAALPTFAIQAGGRLDAFLTLREHFPTAWEVHCMAVRADARRKGLGRALMMHAESWLVDRGVDVLQVKTVARKTAPSAYDETRPFYCAMGFTPLEVFPELWAPQNPCLQLVKFIGRP
ncbi:MAG: GNAT family N-acetyltransferase [Burkholderiaceae bacterium]|jgi:GNAT superfamily N-acetyltransferase|nr:GNAT family N-acetyltransferase [Burkholderiaceae bacterium]